MIWIAAFVALLSITGVAYGRGYAAGYERRYEFEKALRGPIGGSLPTSTEKP